MKTFFILFNFITFTAALTYGQSSFKETAIDWGISHRAHGLIGGGVAIFDYNNDGFQDIYFTGGNYRDELFRNNGNQTFTKVTRHAGLHLTTYYNTVGVIAGDINNDGYADLFVSTENGYESLLFLNKKDGTFQEIGNSAGILGTQWATGATFGDFNLDGYLDIYVTQYIQSHNAIFDENNNVVGFDHTCFPDKMFINNGDLTFETVELSNTNGCGLAAAATDIDNDHFPDIYVANDFGEWVKPNMAFTNNYPETGFTESAASTGLNAAIYGMGIAIGDYNRDGLLDYYVTNLGANVLYKNKGDGTFTDEAEMAGVLNETVGEKLSTSWGAAFFDYDHDGYEDLFVANGYIPAAKLIANERLDPNKLFRNLGNGTFEDVTSALALDNTNIARGMAVGDLDNDGDLDIVIAAAGMDDNAGKALVYKNTSQNLNHWLKIVLEGTVSNKDGFGAKVMAFANNINWIHEVDGGSSHGSHNSKIAHFGLGNNLTLDSIVVIWPGGKKQKFIDVTTNQYLIVHEDSDELLIGGCMDAASESYDPDATYNTGCFIPVEGCLDESTPQFNPEANVQSGSCGEIVTGTDKNNEEGTIMSQDASLYYITSTEFSNLQIVDITGRIVVVAAFKNNYILNKSNLSPGIYIFRLYSNNRQMVKKVVIE